MKAIISFLIFASLTVNEPIRQNTSHLIKESVFITMERTPCFGQCASYKITIFNTGNVDYEGFSFSEKEGKHIKKTNKKTVDRN